MTTQVNQNSKKLSELQLGYPKDEDMIIFERNVDGNSKSYKISYKDFKKSIAGFINIFGVGNMIHCDKNDFSKFAHGHDYSNFDFFPSYGPDSGSTREYINLGSFRMKVYGPGQNVVLMTNTKRVCTLSACDVFINELEGYEPNQVGDIKFFAVENFRKYLTDYLGYTIGSVQGIDNILIDDKFDGWVIPNGASYNCGQEDFTEACTLFGNGASDTSFTVPNLNAFIKAKCTEGMCSYSQFKNALQKHTHSINTDYTSGEREISLEDIVFTQYSSSPAYDGENRGTLHGGSSKDVCSNSSCGKVYINIKGVEITDAKITNSTVSTFQGTDQESYPKHYMLPCLMYIGKSTKNIEQSSEIPSYRVRYYSDNQLKKTETILKGHNGTPPTLTKTGYALSSWEPSYENIIRNTDVCAKWVQAHTVTLKVASGQGTVTGGGSYCHGDTATIVATPSTWWEFQKWSDDGEQSHEITVDKDMQLQAYFYQDFHQLTHTGRYLYWYDESNMGGNLTCNQQVTYNISVKLYSGDKTSSYVTDIQIKDRDGSASSKSSSTEHDVTLTWDTSEKMFIGSVQINETVEGSSSKSVISKPYFYMKVKAGSNITKVFVKGSITYNGHTHTF